MTTFKIQIAETSNPSILKFETNTILNQHNSYEFKNIDEAKNSPIAQQLFYLPFVKTVYISGNFIAIERYDIVSWPEVQNEIADQIANYLNSGKNVFLEEEKGNIKVAVTIYAESTPNPGVIKFVANKKLVAAPYEFKSIDDTKEAPLAKGLFLFPFVKEVFLDENYVSVTKYDVAEWDDITIELREYIRNYIADAKEIVTENIDKVSTETTTIEKTPSPENLDDVSKQIIDILEEYIKPAVASDGGNIMFKSYDKESKTVNVILQGACSGCPSSTFTLKSGIETMLKDMIPNKINEVVAING